MLNAWGIPNGFMIIYVTAWRLLTSKNWVLKLMRDKMDFVIKKGYSKYPICSIFTCFNVRTQKGFSIFLLNTLLKL